VLSIWVVYDHPRDFPDSFVARKFLLDQPTEVVMVAGTLDEIRDIIRRTAGQPLACISRSPDDDPVIVESWL